MNMSDFLLDFHAHVLPGLDHGSDSVETSLSQLKLAKAAGIKQVIATSHFYPEKHNAEEFVRLRRESYLRLAEHLNEDLPKVKLGAEVLMCAGIESMPSLSELFIEGTKILLLELPFADFSPSYADSVYNLTRSGVEVVLAHAERYNEENIDLLIENGARLQLNANVLCGVFIPKHVKRWLKEGRVVALGSDIHMNSKHAYIRLTKAARRIARYLGPIIEYQKKIIE